MNLKLLLLFALLGVALSFPQNGGKTIRTEDCEDEEPHWKCNWWKKNGKCSNNATDWTDGKLIAMKCIKTCGECPTTTTAAPTTTTPSPDEYIPDGKTPGGPWTSEEIDTVRERIHVMIDPRPEKKYEMFGQANVTNYLTAPISEATLMRLTFHDCLKYSDGSGGCDGCLNWEGMGFRFKNFMYTEDDELPLYAHEPKEKTNNNDLSRIVYYLEKIYTTTDWPEAAPSLTRSLKASGKSRADLWAFAGLVALELSIERANWACDHDFNQRMQITLLEGRDACDIKLTKPIKFQYGRADCKPDPTFEFPYITNEHEEHPKLNDGIHVIDLMKRDFGMTAKHFIALSGVHSAAPRVLIHTVGTKYTWFSAAYLSNMYYKMIVNRPTYEWDRGGDPTLVDANQEGWTYLDKSYGDQNGQPIASRGWRVSCMYEWNTTDGGPCFFRPTGVWNHDSPIYDPSYTGEKNVWPCADHIDGTIADGEIVVKESNQCSAAGATFDKNAIQFGGKTHGAISSWKTGWNNQFALGYELGLYYNFTLEGDAHRPAGCPGIDMPVSEWQYIAEDTSTQSDVMQCEKSNYAPEGEAISDIVEAYADNHDLWAENFLDAWQQMMNNGYSSLIDGPQNSWLGHYTIKGRNGDFEDYAIFEGDFEQFILDNAPLVFMNPNADPFLCGNNGGPTSKCGHYVSEYAENWRTYKP